ncbi:MAG: hypothetical protein LBF08_05875 [Dysgonamonadaceae bacterium]|jgi:hypothetical protein|nr:hypothetical protein [Dysgonamonadaceae bacterium]
MWGGKWQSWQATAITMLAVFLPAVPPSILNGIFGETAAGGFMLVSGAAFTFGYKYWLAWTYRRFLRREYENEAN